MPNEMRAYEQLVVEHGLMGYARSALFGELAAGKAWEADLGEGVLEIAELGSFRVQVLGSHSRVSDTFLWVWANPQADAAPEVTTLARSLRERAATSPGLDPLASPRFGSDYVSFEELASVCGELAGGLPFYAGDFGDGAVILIVDTPLEVRVRSPLWLGELLLGFQQVSMADLRECAARFLARCSLHVERTANGLRVRGGDFPTTEIEFDAEGRVSAVTATERASLSPREIVDRMTPAAKRALESAVGAAANRSHREVTVEHWMEALLDTPSNDLAAILASHAIDREALLARARRALRGMGSGTSSRPVFSALLWEWAADALAWAERERGERTLRTGHLLCALASAPSRYTEVDLGELDALDRKRLSSDYASLVAGAYEGEDGPSAASIGPAVGPRELVARLTPTARRLLEAAVGRCALARHPEVRVEHFLEALVRDGEADVAALHAYHDRPLLPLARRVTEVVDAIRPVDRASKPVFSTRIFTWISDAWVYASLKHGAKWVRTGHLFCQLALRPERYLQGDLDELDGLDADELAESLGRATRGRREAIEAEMPEPPPPGSRPPPH